MCFLISEMPGKGKRFQRAIKKPFRRQGRILKKRKLGLRSLAKSIYRIFVQQAFFDKDISLGMLIYISAAVREIIFMTPDFFSIMKDLYRT